MASWLKKFVLMSLRFYKAAVSPWFGNACRYLPTCSEYAMEAVERHGVICGSFMAAKRLLRCHPFASGGYDPVSQYRQEGRNLSVIAAQTE